ncbi:MAG: autotransporter outer membrane beta-barrel domain-containing protein, partial [Alphaproteobacteria bacterium]|nr:autotransporter outer membrane beta-barrel domain-containing protein [Alphaproteobacteria bacterium]
DGGITGTGSVAFSETSLTAALKSSASINGDITGLDKVTIAGLVVETGLSDGSHKLTSTGDADFAGITAENTLYTFEQGDNWGEIKITKKSAEAIAETLTSAGADTTAAQTAAAVTEAKPTTAAAQAVADAITTAAQTGDTATLNALSKAINPADIAVVAQQSVNTASQIFNVAGTRMAANSTGRSGGSMADFAYGPWIQGLYNKTHNTQGSGYNGYSQGFALGVDVDVSKSVMLGAGYGYTATDIKMSGRKTQVYTDNLFLYGKYQPSKWYVSGVVNYGHSNYKEKAILDSKYTVDTYAASAMVGYDTGIFDNYAGVRYTYVNPDSYTNGLTEVNGKNSQIGTAVIGTRISKKYKCNSVIWKPEFRLAATYDFKSDNSTSFVNMVGGSTSYIVEGKRLKRFGVETGVGMTATIAKNTDLTVSYDAGLRDEQISQTGSAKLKFHF